MEKFKQKNKSHEKNTAASNERERGTNAFLGSVRFSSETSKNDNDADR